MCGCAARQCPHHDVPNSSTAGPCKASISSRDGSTVPYASLIHRSLQAPAGARASQRSLLHHFFEHDPGRSVITGTFPAAELLVDSGGPQSGGQRRAHQEEIHAEAGVAQKGVCIDPESIDFLVGMEIARRVDPSLREKTLIR